MRRSKQLVWHYTYSHHIEEIIDSGVLLPPIMCPHYETRTLVPAHMLYSKESVADAKLLLFSQRADWEPASYRAVSVWGVPFPLHKLEDYAKHCIDVYRIAVRRSLLHPWVRLKELVKMPKEMGRNLERIAREIGSNPFDWWGTVKPVPDTQWQAVEVYNPETGLWKPLEPRNSEEERQEVLYA
jgi:hypothetical protein